MDVIRKLEELTLKKKETLMLRLLLFASVLEEQLTPGNPRTPEWYVDASIADVVVGLYGHEIGDRTLYEVFSSAIRKRLEKDAGQSSAA